MEDKNISIKEFMELAKLNHEKSEMICKNSEIISDLCIRLHNSDEQIIKQISRHNTIYIILIWASSIMNIILATKLRLLNL